MLAGLGDAGTVSRGGLTRGGHARCDGCTQPGKVTSRSRPPRGGGKERFGGKVQEGSQVYVVSPHKHTTFTFQPALLLPTAVLCHSIFDITQTKAHLHEPHTVSPPWILSRTSQAATRTASRPAAATSTAPAAAVAASWTRSTTPRAVAPRARRRRTRLTRASTWSRSTSSSRATRPTRAPPSSSRTSRSRTSSVTSTSRRPARTFPLRTSRWGLVRQGGSHVCALPARCARLGGCIGAYFCGRMDPCYLRMAEGAY